MLGKRELGKFRDWVDRAERILVVTHQFPDGDGLASALALRRALADSGKDATIAVASAIPPAFHFLPEVHLFQHDFFTGDYDLIITCDCGDLRRTGFEQRLSQFAKATRRLVNLDHHPKNDLHRIANLNLVDQSVAATAQLVYQLFGEFNWAMDHQIATMLLTGLHTDTGGFKHPNTTPEVLEIAADLLRHGARLQEITRNMNHRRSVATLRLWGIVLDRLQANNRLGVISSMVTLEDLRQCEADHTDVAGVVNLIKAIPSAKIAILFTEQLDGSVKASIRASAGGVDASRLAALFGGGGLKKASGFSIPARIERVSDSWQIVWKSGTLPDTMSQA